MSVEKANRTWHAGKPKKKPDYDREEITEELLAAVVGVYEALDEYGNHPSLQAIVDELDCGLNPLKVRKLLITAGEVQGKKIYESATVDIAFQKALELGEKATGPKKLGVFGASYLYPVFVRLGVINKRWQESTSQNTIVAEK